MVDTSAKPRKHNLKNIVQNSNPVFVPPPKSEKALPQVHEEARGLERSCRIRMGLLGPKLSTPLIEKGKHKRLTVGDALRVSFKDHKKPISPAV